MHIEKAEKVKRQAQHNPKNYINGGKHFMRKTLSTFCACVCILILSTIAHSDEKPLSAYGLTLGQHRDSVEQYFHENEAIPELKDDLHTLYVGEYPESLGCGGIRVLFYEEKLASIDCFNVITGECEDFIIETYSNEFTEISSIYGPATISYDVNDYSDSIHIRLDSWQIEDTHTISLSLDTVPEEPSFAITKTISDTKAYIMFTAENFEMPE